MIDCGATALFLDFTFVIRHRIQTRPLKHPIGLYNIDGSANTAGQITHFARLCLTVDGHQEWTDFLVTNLGGEAVILGLPWLRKVNPTIDWQRGWIHIPENRQRQEGGAREYARRATVVEEVEEEEEEEEGETTSSSAEEEEKEEEEEEGEVEEALFRVRGNRTTRRAWVRAGLVEEMTDTLWCAAGYTYSQKIAEEAHRAKGERTFEEMVPEQYRHHAAVFSEKESERLPEHQPWDHAIDLIPDAPTTIRTKVYPMSLNEQEELNRFIEDNLRKGYIRPSKSPLASPVFFIKKKDGKLRFVQDYRKLNAITIKNRYPLPLVSDIVNRLKGARYFTKFDVRWGYNNIRIKKGDEWKAAFVTNKGLFEPQVMFFGLTNSPATFQALMNTIFADLIAKGKVAVYLDDILIFTQTLEEHRRIVNEVLQRLRKHDLYLRPEKCEFEREEIEYLGLVIRAGEVGMDPGKVKAVREWPAPKNLREVRGFLGFANFYRRFIKDFSKVARPLNDLTKKDTPWTWGETQNKAFEDLREAFISAPVLTLWDPSRPTRLEVDASGYATGGVLLQKLEDELWHPVAFRSASMQPAERNYQIYDREMLAIIEALKDWRHFLEGLPQTFEIITDHSNLEYWRTAQDLGRRQCRWSLYLSRFDFILTHRPGKANTQADPLSRMPHHKILDAEDNQQQVVLKPEHFHQLAATSTDLRNPLEDRIRQASSREAEVLEGLAQLRKGGPRRLANGLPEWEEKEGLVYHKGRVYVPADESLRKDVVKQCHDDPTAGHPGIHSTLELVDRHFWWPHMRAFVRKYVEGCDLCARKKHQSHPRSTTQPLAVPKGPWEEVGVDLITQLPTAHGKDAIIVFTDLFSKMVHVLPCTSDLNSEKMADIYYEEIFRLHGLPLRFVSDRGPQFASQLTRNLLRRLGIQSNLTTAYHPQSNGQTERANQEVEKYLRLYVSRRQDDWDKHLPMAEFVMNSRAHSAHERSPFEVVYGYLPLFNIPVGDRAGVRAVEERVKHLQDVRTDVEAALRMEKERQKAEYERGKNTAHQFKVGDYVWLNAKDIQIKVPTRKLGDLQLGPFQVIEKVGELDYKLKLSPDLSRLHPVFHVDKLSAWKGNDVNGVLPPPPEAVEIEGDLEWEVAAILDSKWVDRGRGRNRKKVLRYLVDWKGYNETSWQDEEDVRNATELVEEFHKRHPAAPRRIKASVFNSISWKPLENFTDSVPSEWSWEDGRILATIIEDDEA